MTSGLQYNPYTGLQVVAGESEVVPAAAALGLEPPRYCPECGRKMVVQIVPDGWSSICSRHGVTDSAALGRR